MLHFFALDFMPHVQWHSEGAVVPGRLPEGDSKLLPKNFKEFI